MGTINYKTSEFITLGLEPFNYDDYFNEDGELDYVAMNADEDNIYLAVKEIIDDYSFDAFKVKLEIGYYEGFQIVIGFDWLYYEDDIEIYQAQEEAKKLKELLLRCVDAGLVQCYPSWGTTYENEEDTRHNIETAYEEMLHVIDNLPTYEEYMME